MTRRGGCRDDEAKGADQGVDCRRLEQQRDLGAGDGMGL